MQINPELFLLALAPIFVATSCLGGLVLARQTADV